MAQSLVERILPHLEEILLASPNASAKPHSERSLSERLGVSRPILREALRSLRQRGLIEIVPGKGIFPARNIDKPTVIAMQDYLRRKEIGFPDLFEGRLFLETRIAQLAAERRTERDLSLLEDAWSRMNASIDDANPFEQADLEFHHLLAAAAQNALYLIWLQPIIGRLEERRNRVVILGEVRANALAAHREILNAVRDGDAPRARDEMEKHLRAFKQDTQRAIELGLLPPESDGSRLAN